MDFPAGRRGRVWGFVVISRAGSCEYWAKPRSWKGSRSTARYTYSSLPGSTVRGRPYLLAIEAVDASNIGEDVFGLRLGDGPENFHRLIDDAFFFDLPPRWILLCGLRSSELLERDKRGSERMLRFNRDEIYG